jgi:glycolate oxidase
MKHLAHDLSKLISRDKILSEPEDLFAYAGDATFQQAQKTPDLVVLPNNTSDVSKVLKYANQFQIPITPRGAGSGLAGGSTPIQKGIVLDLKRMNAILDINRGNMTAMVESGTVLNHFHSAVESQQLFYPPDPQSKSVCTIGGNIATRAGGPRAVKYGTTGAYVLGLEVVLADGEVIQTGGTCVKNASGYDLTHLFTGSEGTLGVITKANLRLIPLPRHHQTIIISCNTAKQAATLVSEIIANGIVPAMLEYITQSTMILLNRYLIEPLSTEGEAFLFLDLDGDIEQIRKETQQIRDLCFGLNVLDIRMLNNEVEAKSYWDARSKLYPALVTAMKKIIVEDVTVPRERLPELVRTIAEISNTSGLKIDISGHAGDGNFHPSIMLDQMTPEIEQIAHKVAGEIVESALNLGGGISGEHGIGLHKVRFLPMELGERQVALQKQIKKAIDPQGIMNPGKIWSEE